MTTTERRISLGPGELTLAVVETVPAEPTPAPLLVCLHGFLEQGASWTGVAERLHRRVLAPDQRGFGRSDHVGAGGFYHFWDYVSDLDLLLEQVSPDTPVDLLGHSMGGTVACLYAGTRPERIRRLVLVEGLGPPDTEATLLGRAKQFLRHRRAPPQHKVMASVEAAAERMRKHNPKLEQPVAHGLAARATRELPGGDVTWAWDTRHRARSPRPFVEAHFLPFVRAIEAPTLVAWGADSPFPGLDRARELVGAPDVQIERFEGAGHLVHHDARDRLADAIDAFLG